MIPPRSTGRKLPAAERREAILDAVTAVFIDKGFDGTTTRDLAAAAGVSEALLYRHFPSKQALYAAIIERHFGDAGERLLERRRVLKPSTAGLVSLIHDHVAGLLGPHATEHQRSFFRLLARSLVEEEEFSRLGTQGAPSEWVSQVMDCMLAAKAESDMHEVPVHPQLAAWMALHVVMGVVLHSMPARPVIDYGLPREEVVRQVTRFCLRGMGLKEEAIRRYYDGEDPTPR